MWVGEVFAVLTWSSTGPLGFGEFAGHPAMPQSSDPTWTAPTSLTIWPDSDISQKEAGYPVRWLVTLAPPASSRCSDCPGTAFYNLWTPENGTHRRHQ